jgi:hypothetical protein
MEALQSSSDVGERFYEQAKQALNVGLNNLIEDTKNQAIMLGNNLEVEGVKSIVENLKRMQRAEFASKYLDKPDEIDKSVTEIKKMIEERIIRYLKGIEALITSNNFYETDKKFDSVTLVRNLLGNSYCTPAVTKQIEDLKERQNEVVLKDVVDKYSKMDIDRYNLNPPADIFKKFKEVDNTNPIYDQALTIIKEKIFDKLRAELDAAKSKKPLDPENIHIRNFESGVKYLPEDMRSALEVELIILSDVFKIMIRNYAMHLIVGI